MSDVVPEAEPGGQDPPPSGSTSDVDAGSYEVVRRRLADQSKALQAKADALNLRRRETFGGTELAILATERVRTENNCVPADVISVGGKLLLGYNVFIGLKAETAITDVFSLHRFETTAEGAYDLSELPAGDVPFLADPTFARDFRDLYKYYKDTRLARLQKTDSKLLAVFQTGSSARDVKVFRWRLSRDGVGAYVDNRGDEDLVVPRQHDFEWNVVGRDRLVSGRFPHLSIEDEVFVETTQGDLTIKVENNTDTGRGIYTEPVDDINQSLDDADVRYARVGGLILLRIKPYREEAYRHLVFNTRTRRVVRIDAIGNACIQLPEGQGIIFPGGYYLQTGDFKRFDGDSADLEFERAVKSPNGEDVLYVFHRRSDGVYVLFAYNLIRKEVQTPISCHGVSLFDDGRLLVLRVASPDPTRVHPVQIWQTPFATAEHASTGPADGSYLSKIGNGDLVRGISDCYSVCRLVAEQHPTRQVYEDLVALVARVLDAYYWLSHPEVGDLASALTALRGTAELIVDEFEKVIAIRKRAEEAVTEAEEQLRALIDSLRPEDWVAIEPFLDALGRLRGARGHLITLRDLRYVDLPRLDSLEKESVAAFERVSESCVRFLAGGEALKPLATNLQRIFEEIERLARTVEVQPLAERLETTGEGLTVLGEIVGTLAIGDPTVRTAILEGIGEVFSLLNRVRATLAAKRKELATHEGRAEFGAQFRLLSQNVTGALALCDTPERCDEQLARLMVQLEEMEGRFGEIDDFVAQLSEKREEIYDAFGARKQQLLDDRQRRAQSLIGAAERILGGMGRRARSFKTTDELHAYFASDAMVLKVRQIAEQLAALGDSVKSDELESRLKSTKQDALRALRDRLDLYEGGADVIKLGRHRFNVNTQPIELTLVPKDDGMSLHVSGTDFLEPVVDEAFSATRAFWDQSLVSEDARVYRGEYLAWSMLVAAEEGKDGPPLADLQRAALAPGGTAELVRLHAATRYDEGYERGIHDADASQILERLLALRASAGLLRFGARARSLACLFWAFLGDDGLRAALHRRAASLGRLRHAFGEAAADRQLVLDLAASVESFARAEGLSVTPGELRQAGRYLSEELAAEQPRFATSAEAAALAEKLAHRLERDGTRVAFEDDLKTLEARLAERQALVAAWLSGFARSAELGADDGAVQEAAAIVLAGRRLDRAVTAAPSAAEVTGLLGQHPRITERKLTLRLDEMESRLGEFCAVTVPGFRDYRAARHRLLEAQRTRLRLDELRPRILSSFVRNRLIDEVYLPLIGTNLAKQLGAAGEGKRTDLMGLLLLISPPGYGKTTLMEYVASRLGLVFVKVNGPTLGEGVRSFDPEEAPNATARQEVDKINLAFEMGNNVMLYLDDIQHTSPELLQKFISLCDAQRVVEGVWKGRTRRYDLRGKKFCVVMAGNPYTESGARFQIPDMLANRADTYNLGDILEGKDDVFALSYVENAITSNPVLAPMASRDLTDVHKVVRMAKGEEVPTSELSFGYSAAELSEIVVVLQRLFSVQAVLLRVNAEYIASASQDDRFRTEPPFKLQGSYRNMNKLAEKVVAAMNEEELDRLLDDHYGQESQTLTTGAEHNLLKLKELRGKLSEAEKVRWAEIKKAYAKAKARGGDDADPATRVSAELEVLGEHLEGIRDAVAQAVWNQVEGSKKRKAPRTDLFLAPVLQSLPPLLEKIDTTLSALAPSRAPERPPGGGPAAGPGGAAGPGRRDPGGS